MVANAEFDPIVVDRELDPRRAEDLIARGRESAKLDYKQQVDPSQTRDVVELTKDLVAMANSAGGYIVIGVTDDGGEVGLSDEQVRELDEAKLRAQVESYLGASVELYLDLRVVHTGRKYPIVTVLRSTRAPIVFQKDGQYPSPGNPQRTATAFREGDVYVRHGSASERWNQDDVQTIYSRVIDREKEKWMAETVPDVRRLIQAAVGGAAAVPTAQEVLRTDAETFQRTIDNLLLPRST